MFPAARVGDMTVTGDASTWPGAATVLIGAELGGGFRILQLDGQALPPAHEP